MTGFVAALVVSELAIGNGALTIAFSKVIEWGSALSLILFENNFRALVAVAGFCFALVFAGLPSICAEGDMKKKTQSNEPRWHWFQLCNYLAVFVFILSSCAILNQRNQILHRNPNGNPNLAGRSIVVFAGSTAFLSLGYMLAFFGVSFVSADVESDTDDMHRNGLQHICGSPRPQVGQKSSEVGTPHCSFKGNKDAGPRDCKVKDAKPMGFDQDSASRQNIGVTPDSADCIVDVVDEADCVSFTRCLLKGPKKSQKRKKWRKLHAVRKHWPMRKRKVQDGKEAAAVEAEAAQKHISNSMGRGDNTATATSGTKSQDTVAAVAAVAAVKAQADPLTMEQVKLQNVMFPLLLDMAESCEWQLKLDDRRRSVQVSNRTMPGSNWAALKARTTIACAPETVRDLLLERHEAPVYDEMLATLKLLHAQDTDTNIDSEECRCALLPGMQMRWARFKGVWPTSPRDFVILSGCTNLTEAVKRGWAPADKNKKMNRNKNQTTAQHDHGHESPHLADPDRTYIIASRSADHVFPLLPAPETLSCGSGSGSDADVTEAVDSRKQLERSQDRRECVRGKLHISGYIIRPIPPPSDADANANEVWSEVSLVAHSELGGNIPTSLVNKFAIPAPAKMVHNIKKMALKREQEGR